MKINNLTITQVKKLSYSGKGKFKAHSVDSSCKLYLLCYASGAKVFKFRKSNSTYITIDDYAHTTLAEARQKAQEFYRQEAKGELEKQNCNELLRDVFFEWLDNVKLVKVSEDSENYVQYLQKRRKIINRVNKWVLKPFGDKKITQITKQDIIYQTTKKERMNYPTAIKLLPMLKEVFKYARANGAIKEYGFMFEILDDMDALYPKSEVKHRKAPDSPERLGQIMRIVKDSNIKPVIKNLFFLSLIMAQRPHQFRELTWDRVDLKNGFLYFGGSDNKTKLSRVRIPLPRQATKILQAQKQLCIENSNLVFQSSVQTRRTGWQLSENTLMDNIKNLGIDDLHAHGFRSILSTFAIRASEVIDGVERAKFEKRIIDEVTLHTKGSEVDKAYFRDFNSKEHLRLLQWWADYLDSLETIEARSD